MCCKYALNFEDFGGKKEKCKNISLVILYIHSCCNDNNLGFFLVKQNIFLRLFLGFKFFAFLNAAARKFKVTYVTCVCGSYYF